MKDYIKKQPLSIFLAIVVWLLCMIPIPDSPLDSISMFDKWTHLVMYATIVITIMAEYGRRKSRIQWWHLIVGGLLVPIAMSGIIELAQAYLTEGVRSGDWYDFLANTVGAVMGSAIGIPLARFLATRNRDAQT